MAHEVFISHASEDREVAGKVCARLEAERIKCWIAPRDIIAGRNWSKAIMDALDQTRALVAIVSARSNASEQVLREITLAADRKLPIVPLVIDDSPLTPEFEFFLATPHRLEASPPPLERHLPRLVEAVQRVIEPWPLKPSDPPDSTATVTKPLKVALVYKRNVPADERLLAVLESGLKKLGHSVFIDRHMAIGVDWAREIDEQIRSSDAVVALLSETSIHSEMLTYEVQTAHNAAERQGKPRILPVRLQYEGPLPADIAGILSRLQYFHWKGEEDNTTLVEQVSAALTRPAKPTEMPSPPGGALQLDSKYYVIRPTDQEFLSAVSRGDAIVLVKGARQMGKTSLMARGLEQAREARVAVALTDFQKLSQREMASVETFYLALGDLLADRLNLTTSPADKWNSKRSPNVNFERFIRSQVLDQIETHLVWGMDEVDRLFTCPFGSEVFALFRTWHNERAVDPTAAWSKLTLAIAYATEAHLFITDVNQSPFNVGTRLTLQDFTPEQVADLNRRYGSPLRAPDELARLHRLTAGQPFLVQRALYDLATRDAPLSDLEQRADSEDGPFGDHLRRMLVMLAKDPPLLDITRRVLKRDGCPSQETFYRLRSAGIITGTSAHDCAPRCQLYATYLQRHLS